MNVYSATAGLRIAAALLGKPRVEQEVRIIDRISGEMGMRYIVRVIPAGEEQGELYEVMNRRTLDLLREGKFSPEDLELSTPEGME